jgi:hypothetical protein
VRIELVSAAAAHQEPQPRQRFIAEKIQATADIPGPGTAATTCESGHIQRVVDPADLIAIARQDLGELLGVKTADLAVEAERAVLFRHADRSQVSIGAGSQAPLDKLGDGRNLRALRD